MIRLSRCLLSLAFSVSLVHCASVEPDELEAEGENTATTQSALNGTRHQQSTRAGVSAWVTNETADALVAVSTIGDSDPVQSRLSRTHFDNCYWNESRDWIVANRKQAVKSAIRYFESGDPTEKTNCFNALGYALHATQDFYAHSNWVGTHTPGEIAPIQSAVSTAPPGWYSGTYNNPGDPSGTGQGVAHCPTGTPTHGQMNLDGAGGAAKDEAFLDAAVATSDLIRQFAAEVNAVPVISAREKGPLNALGFLKSAPATTTARTDLRRTIEPTGSEMGFYSPVVYCRPGTFVAAFQQRVEASIGSGDDTALNAVALYCADRSGKLVERLSTWEGMWGEWSEWNRCQNTTGFLSGTELKVEAPQNSGDDTSANAARFWCTDGSNVTANNDGQWGSWTGRVNCEAGEAICGIQVRYTAPQASGDDSGMNGMKLHCCAL